MNNEINLINFFINSIVLINKNEAKVTKEISLGKKIILNNVVNTYKRLDKNNFQNLSKLIFSYLQ